MTQPEIDEVIRQVATSFRTDEREQFQLARLLRKYPKTTPQETWIILPILFVRGIMDSEKLRAMPYAKFLQTGYWLAVSAHVKGCRPWCALCCEPTAGPLEVHHRTYEHRGSEWQHLEDLTVLCHDCHEWTTLKTK